MVLFEKLGGSMMPCLLKDSELFGEPSYLSIISIELGFGYQSYEINGKAKQSPGICPEIFGRMIRDNPLIFNQKLTHGPVHRCYSSWVQLL